MENPFNKIKTTIIFFIAYFLLAILVNILVPGDMCNPGGGFGMIVLLVPITSILLLLRIIKKKREY